MELIAQTFPDIAIYAAQAHIPFIKMVMLYRFQQAPN
jgi:hypothetical protein